MTHQTGHRQLCNRLYINGGIKNNRGSNILWIFNSAKSPEYQKISPQAIAR